MPRSAIALFLLLPACVFVQAVRAAPPAPDAAAPVDDDRWTVGVGVSVQDSPYAGEDLRIRPFPLVTWEGERVYWHGVTFGVHLMQTGRFALDAVVSGRFDGFDRGDLGGPELARNGVDIERLADRDDGVDAGLAARWRWGGGSELRLRAVADVTGASEGYELSADYGHRFQFGRTTLVPGIGVQWLSDDLAGYYYGVRDSETLDGTGYRPEAAVVPRVQLALSRPLAGKWRLTGLLQYRFLPDELADSPLLERKGTGHLVIGATRAF